MNKICTTIEQSKKLAEILPLESADMSWYRPNIMYPYELHTKYRGHGVMADGSDDLIPAWSLAALIDLMPNVNGHYPELCRGKQTGQYYMWIEDTFDTQTFDNPIDAAFEMICWLKENNKI